MAATELTPRNWPLLTRIVPADARLFPPASERPATIRHGLGHPSSAQYADGREVVAEHDRRLGLITGLDWRRFGAWRFADETEEEYRIRQLPMLSYSYKGARWEIRLDWAYARVWKNGERMPRVHYTVIGPGRVRVHRGVFHIHHAERQVRALVRLVGIEGEVDAVSAPPDPTWDDERGQPVDELREFFGTQPNAGR